jgi:hypothetical protein
METGDDTDCNKDCNKEYFYLFITSLFTSFLWLLSEVIGSMACKSNGILEFIVNGFSVQLKYEVVEGDDDGDVETNENDGASISSERALLIKKTLPHYMGI